MINFLSLYAHAVQHHTTETTAADHILTNPLALSSIYASALLVIWIGLKQHQLLKRYRLLAIIAVSLPIAFVSYPFVPALAAAAIIIGFMSSLLLTLATIS